MQTVFTEGKYAGEYIASEAPGEFSRDVVTLAQAAGGTLIPCSACTVLGKLTASGKYTPVVLGANDGSQTAAAILYDNVDNTTADAQAVVTIRQSEVNGAELIYPAGATTNQIAAINASLATAGIIVRAGI